MRHSSQILSNAFDIPRKTSATTKSLSNDFYILWVIAKSWYMQEVPGLNLDWLGEISLISIKNLKTSLKINFSKHFPQIGSRDTGR